jgi:hypothetical protein
MSSIWREVASWRCGACGAESLLVEREDRSSPARAGAFERRCAACGDPAPGVTIRPAGRAYGVTTRREFYPERVYRNSARARSVAPAG